MTQKEIFLESEGDAWLRRNAGAVAAAELPAADPLLSELLQLLPADASGTRVLEIGCGDGTRLGWLRDHRGIEAFGIDPSSEAVAVARGRGIDARQGTADQVPFDAASFDIVSFGFCLYLCDRTDLFRIASEADRVLRSPGWLAILDFYSPSPSKREYHHRAGVYSYKMDYRTLFTWNPAYTCFTQRVIDHAHHGIIDDPAQWVAVSVLRKNVERIV